MDVDGLGQVIKGEFADDQAVLDSIKEDEELRDRVRELERQNEELQARVERLRAVAEAGNKFQLVYAWRQAYINGDLSSPAQGAAPEGGA